MFPVNVSWHFLQILLNKLFKVCKQKLPLTCVHLEKSKSFEGRPYWQRGGCVHYHRLWYEDLSSCYEEQFSGTVLYRKRMQQGFIDGWTLFKNYAYLGWQLLIKSLFWHLMVDWSFCTSICCAIFTLTWKDQNKGVPRLWVILAA